MKIRAMMVSLVLLAILGAESLVFAEQEVPCDLQAPKAALKLDTKKFRYSIKRTGSELVEKAHHQNGVGLLLTQSGCDDGQSIELEFTAQDKKFPASADQQIVWTRDRLREFNCVGDRCRRVSRGIELITKHTDQVKAGRLTICNDGSPADNDEECSFQTGGTTHFEVKRREAGQVVITLSQFESA